MPVSLGLVPPVACMEVLPEMEDAFLLSSGQAVLIERWIKENMLYGEKPWEASKQIVPTYKLTAFSSLLVNMTVILS